MRSGTDLPDSVVKAQRRAAAELLRRLPLYADDMLDYIVKRIPEADGDDKLRGLTLGSCSSNLEAALSMFRNGIDVTAASAPVTALEHARAMAARGYSVDVMLRYYRLGHAYMSALILDRLRELVPDPALAVVVLAELQNYAFAYVDRISSEVAAEYVAELDRIQNRVRAARTDAVRRLLAGDQVDLGRAEGALSHRLTGRQTAFVCWTEREDTDLARVGKLVGAHLGSDHPLLVPDGTQTLWGWVSTSGVPEVTRSGLVPLVDQIPKGVRVSVGIPAQGPAGFRKSHAQAQRGRRIIELAGRDTPVTAYAEMALVDTMSDDLDLARAFVVAELGPLAVAGAREAEERQALLAVLNAQGGLTAAGEELGIHRNTVLQRLRRAEERRGRPASARIAEVHAALRLVDVLGPVVLTQNSGLT
ncbi:DNA-binding PucR family transcriptional regulator [Rhodococcus erythropolis]|uniref:PucR family transcriptional regulator n=1 Tax=Rhodococcus erythropolis TaxID=1833 RepID=UPI002168244C|nr:helix-turn-helix domain-containing protein [Rhodococcus erythropolis]MCS4258017.1 DNA-binding PucR family transcriptional regulator [Rhodococcus erythropolis]MCW2425189.1 DNA-binding PucR family transcriptional regulator [Rhodococcus erythropolis]